MSTDKNRKSRALISVTDDPTDEYMRRVQQLEAFEKGELTKAPAWLKKVQDESAAHTELVIASKVEHPDQGAVDFDSLTPEQLAEMGFDGKVSAEDLLKKFGIAKRTSLGKTFNPADFGIEELDFRKGRGRNRGRGRNSNRGRRGNGGNGGGNQGNPNQGGQGAQQPQGRSKTAKKGKSGGGRGGKQLPKASDVDTVVASYLKGLNDAGKDGNIRIGEFNAEFLDAAKANAFIKSYSAIVKKFHIIGMIEVDSSGLQPIAQAAGYTAYTSVANTRNQAVGFLVHPRLKVLKVYSIDSVANVGGVPDLRPAFCLDLQDTVSGVKFTAVVVHMKSMRGGEGQTGPIRYKQFDLLQKALGTDAEVVILGDMNCKLPGTNDIKPLLNAGYKLLNPKSTVATQSMGSRIDGFFWLKLPGKLGKYAVRAIFENKVFGRGFSDHGVCSAEMRLCAVPGSNDGSCSTTDATDGDFGDDPKNDGKIDPQ